LENKYLGETGSSRIIEKLKQHSDANLDTAKSYTDNKTSELASAVQKDLDATNNELSKHAENAAIHLSSTGQEKLNGIESGAQKNTITGVKGDAESSYRTGNINITATNIGLGNVDNTADADKTVAKAIQDGDGNVIADTYAKKTDFVAITIPEIDAICIIPLDPGLYQDGAMVMSWDELVEDGMFNTDALSGGYLIDMGGYTPSFTDGELVITDETGVTQIGSTGDNFAKVILIDSTAGIDSGAFSGYTNLIEVSLPQHLTTIDYAMFNQCNNLSKVLIPSNVTSFMENCFCKCIGLKEITLPETTTYIGADAFAGSGLQSIRIPSNALNAPSSGWHSFGGCKSLTSVTIEPGNTSLNYGIFSGCSALMEIVIPEGVTLIGEGAFDGCTALTSVALPSSLTNLEVGIFYDCTSLTQINFSGTMAQWNSLGQDNVVFNTRLFLGEGSAISSVVCSDGTVTITAG